MNEEKILEKMGLIAEALDFQLNENAPKIARVKSRMDNWRKCPCDIKNPLRYCGSELCELETKKTGTCHCGCYLKEED